MGRFERTPLGYPQDEVVSALQKEIRRGREKEAVFWALELAGTGGGAARLWRRLCIIAVEDVAATDPAVLQLAAAAELWREVKDDYVIGFAVVTLARARKNREVSMLVSIVKSMREAGEKLEIPEYALDGHTRKGRKLWGKREAERLIDWVENGQLCANVAGPNRYAEEWVMRRAKAKGLVKSQVNHALAAIRKQYPAK